MATDKTKISDLISKLEKIVQWFDAREDVDVEEALKKVKEGAELVKALKSRLNKVENEFEEVKKDLDTLDTEE